MPVNKASIYWTKVKSKPTTLAGFGITDAIANGQTWTDVSASRLNNTVYTNTTGKPIQISFSCILLSGTSFDLKINGLTVAHGGAGSVNSQGHFMNVIPAGATYQISTIGNPGRITWSELR